MAAETTLDDPDSCYFVLLTGEKCNADTKGGAYKITADWYENHYGGTFAAGTSNGCGSVIESWPEVNPSHQAMATYLEGGINIKFGNQVVAEYVEGFDGECPSKGWTEQRVADETALDDPDSC